MSQAYLAGVRDQLTNAQVTFDRYHVKQKLSEAIDTVRRQEAKQHQGLLKGTRYLWLKRPDNLTVNVAAEEYLRRWVSEANASELEPLAAFAEMLEAHWEGVIRWHHTRVSNGLLEGLNSLIQAAKRQSARVPLGTQLQDDDLPRRRQAATRASGHVTGDGVTPRYTLRTARSQFVRGK